MSLEIPPIGCCTTTIDWSTIPRLCEVARASRANGVVARVSVGMPRRSSWMESRTLRDVHDPQSACETTTTSGRRAAIAVMVLALSSRGDTDSGTSFQYRMN